MPRFATICLAIALLICGSEAQGLEQSSLTVGGYIRTYAIEAPADLSGPTALVLVLHGAGGQGGPALQHYRWDRKAKAEGFVAVAPDALPAFPDQPANFRTNPRYWNDGSARGLPQHQKIDDVAFLAALIDALSARYSVDPHRIYVTGFSSGASMTHRAGIDLADRLAAIAPVAGKGWSLTTPSRPVPALYLVGDQDPLTPLAGGPVKLPWGNVQDYPPARQVPDNWVKFDACETPPAREAPQAQVALEAWRRCAGTAEVLFYTVAGLGHEWAGGRGRALPEAMTGPYTDAVDTTALIWDFFKRHRRE
jgi:polyhydroxybutyrate depolymerase